MQPTSLLEQIHAFMGAWETMSLATVDERGRPHAASLQFACGAGLQLYFISSPATAHAQHIARDPHVALTVYAHVTDPWKIHGVQMHGTCAAIDKGAAAHQRAWAAYAARFHFIESDSVIHQRIEAEQFYLVRPTWVRLIDNRKGFGWKQETELREGNDLT